MSTFIEANLKKIVLPLTMHRSLVELLAY